MFSDIIVTNMELTDVLLHVRMSHDIISDINMLVDYVFAYIYIMIAKCILQQEQHLET